jgi:mono/diheme cytochrome c family protein
MRPARCRRAGAKDFPRWHTQYAWVSLTRGQGLEGNGQAAAFPLRSAIFCTRSRASAEGVSTRTTQVSNRASQEPGAAVRARRYAGRGHGRHACLSQPEMRGEVLTRSGRRGRLCRQLPHCATLASFSQTCTVIDGSALVYGGNTMRAVTWLAALLSLAFGARQVLADEASLSLDLVEVKRSITASELLDRPDAAEVVIPSDHSYGRGTRYRAVPLLPLLSSLPNGRFDTLEARAADGFVAQIPLSLVGKGGEGGATAWIAVEQPGQPWPNLPGRSTGAGPFYLVWTQPERSSVTNEQWVYNLASLTATESPAHRWPQLAADPSLPREAPARRGEQVFAANCLPCHRVNGGGAGEMGPDLGRPMNAVDYLTRRGLRDLVRDPKSVRSWPLQQMPGFTAETLPDSDLDALIDYLHHIADRSGLAAGKQ